MSKAILVEYFNGRRKNSMVYTDYGKLKLGLKISEQERQSLYYFLKKKGASCCEIGKYSISLVDKNKCVGCEE